MAILEQVDEADSLWRVRSALSGLHDALATDHYALEVTGLDDRRLAITIRARDGACEECLISRAMISDLIRTQMPSDLSDRTIDLAFDVPADWSSAA